jgi:hypothetical protein
MGAKRSAAAGSPGTERAEAVLAPGELRIGEVRAPRKECLVGPAEGPGRQGVGNHPQRPTPGPGGACPGTPVTCRCRLALHPASGLARGTQWSLATQGGPRSRDHAWPQLGLKRAFRPQARESNRQQLAPCGDSEIGSWTSPGARVGRLRKNPTEIRQRRSSPCSGPRFWWRTTRIRMPVSTGR